MTEFGFAQSLNLTLRNPRVRRLEGGVEVLCYGGRRFLTKEEKVEWLEEYKSNLENELKGVTERIEELKH